MPGFFDELGTFIVNTAAEGYKLVQGVVNSNKPKSYQAIANLIVNLAAIVINDENTKVIPKQAKITAIKLMQTLENKLKKFDNDIATHRVGDHKKIERDFIKECHKVLYSASPKLTAAPDLWSQIAATLNALTQYAAGFNIIPESWITRTRFFADYQTTQDKLSKEFAKMQLNDQEPLETKFHTHHSFTK